MVHAQNDLLKKLETQYPDTTFTTQATFKTTRIAIGHSVETRKKGTFQFSVMTRYWDNFAPRGNAFIVDRMTARFGADYAFSNKFTTGMGYSTLTGIADAFAKYRLLTQTQNNTSPVSITAVQMASYRTKNFNNVMLDDSFLDRTAFTTQILIARKFTQKLSLQIAPTFVHRSSSQSPLDDTNHFALGFGARYKLGNHTSIVSEYYYLLNELDSRNTFGAFAMGVNWEMGDLILQFKLTNARHFAVDTFVTQTPFNFNFKQGYPVFGFHVNYILHTKKKK